MPKYAETKDDLLTIEQMKSMSGFDFIDGIRAGRFPAPPIAKTLNFEMVEVAVGRVAFEGKVLFSHYNPLGGGHGGWFGAILDSCMACAVQTTLPVGTGYTTLEYRINITRPVFEHTERLRAVGEALHVGKRTGTAEGKLIGVESGKLYAFGTTTCLVMAL